MDDFAGLTKNKPPEENKPKPRIQSSRHYMKPIVREDPKNPPRPPISSSNVVNDDFEDAEGDEIDFEAVKKTQKNITSNPKKYKYSNEILSEMKKNMTQTDVDKMLNMMSKEEEKKEPDSQGNPVTEEESKRYEKLNSKIKETIKKKGEFDFTRLSKEEHDLLVKMRLQSQKERKINIINDRAKEFNRSSTLSAKPKSKSKPKKENEPKRPASSKINRSQIKPHLIKDTKAITYTQKFINLNKNDEFNNNLEYIPKPVMNGFLLKAYKRKKPKDEDEEGGIKAFKAKPMPKFLADDAVGNEKKKVEHPFLVHNGDI